MKFDYLDYLNKPYHGDWFDFAKIIPDNTVQFAVTSPPYWRMRNYGLPPTVWGGSSECEHSWGEAIQGSKYGRYDTSSPNSTDFGGWANWDGDQGTEAGKFCEKECGAWLGQLGLEPTPYHFIMNLADCFDEVRRTLRMDGNLAVIIGDCYASGGLMDKSLKYNQADWERSKPTRELVAGLKKGDLVGIPHLLAFELRRRGWVWRQDAVWYKPNPMSEPVLNRCTRSHESILIFTKSTDTLFWTHRNGLPGVRSKPDPDYFWKDRLRQLEFNDEPENWKTEMIANPDKSKGAPRDIKRYSRINKWKGNNYYWDAEAIREPTRDKRTNRIVGWHNKHDVWKVATSGVKESHYAPFPRGLIEPLIQAGSSAWGCCAECGAPNYRVIEKGEEDRIAQKAAGGNKDGKYIPVTAGKGYAAIKQRILKSMKKHRTVGWKSTCSCDSEKKNQPCLVLDPFGGSFTTGLAARNLGRHFLSSDISDKFIEIGEIRLEDDLPSDQIRIEKKGAAWK